MRPHPCTCAAVALALSAGASLAHAQSTAPAGFGDPTSNHQLAAMAGGADLTNNITQQFIDGRMSDTSATDTVSGANVMSGSAFGSAAGVNTVIQNSGNNVLIQSATIVNLRMNP